MQSPVENQPRDSKSAYRNWDIKLFALPVLFMVALIGLVDLGLAKLVMLVFG